MVFAPRERHHDMEMKKFMADKDDPKWPKLLEVAVFGTVVRVLFNYSAMPDVMFAKL